jgi:hypothetical protein
MSGPVGAGAGAPVPTSSGLRDPTPEEREEMWVKTLPYSNPLEYPERTPEATLKWLKEHPDVRVDGPLYPRMRPGQRGDPEAGWDMAQTLAFHILGKRKIDPKSELVQELFRHIPDFKRKDAKGFTLQGNLDISKRRSGVKLIQEEKERRATNPGTLAGLEQLARQKNLPPEIQALIGEQATGLGGLPPRQRNTARAQVGLPPLKPGGRRRGRKTRRTRRR